jgi:hypothetical protein
MNILAADQRDYLQWAYSFEPEGMRQLQFRVIAMPDELSHGALLFG